VESLTDTLKYLKKYRSNEGVSSAVRDHKETASVHDVELIFCKKFYSFMKKKTVRLRSLLKPCSNLIPNLKLDLSLEFWLQCYNHWREVLAAAATQQTFQISIELQWFTEHVEGSPYGTLCLTY
jgi:hypothetical protein